MGDKGPFQVGFQQEFDEKGYVLLRQVFSADEVDLMKAESDRLLQAEWVDPKNVRTPFALTLISAPNVLTPLLMFRLTLRIWFRINGCCGQLRSYWATRRCYSKTKLILKAPGVDGYHMHQDWAWGWQKLCPADDILSVSFKLMAAVRVMADLSFPWLPSPLIDAGRFGHQLPPRRVRPDRLHQGAADNGSR